MNKIKLFSQFVHWAALILMLLGCAINNPEKSLQTTITPGQVKETSTSLPSPHPSMTITPRQTVMPSPEPRLFPTQGELSDEAFVIQLLQTNGGCELPCWWGIVPQETRWEDTERFLSGIVNRIEKTRDETENGADGKPHQNREFHVYVDIGQTKPYLFAVRTKDDLVTEIYVSQPPTKHHFSLRELLNNQGVPSKIFMHTHSNVIEPPTAFTLVLYYQVPQFLVVYKTLVYKENEEITACLDDVDPTIAIISGEEGLTDQQVQEFFLGPDPRGVLSVENALGLTPDAFYETYRASETICITTPANIWP